MECFKMGAFSTIVLLFLLAAVFTEGQASCNTDGLPSIKTVPEDQDIGGTKVIWIAKENWTFAYTSNAFGFLYIDFEYILRINFTKSTDLDEPGCNSEASMTVNMTCADESQELNITLSPVNNYGPEFVNTQHIPSMPASLKENYPTFTSIIEFGNTVEDRDCPAQRLAFSVGTSGLAKQVDYFDGTLYFDIDQNGTLYLKRPLDYETTICSITSVAYLYLDVIIKDGGSSSRMTSTALSFIVLDVDDEPPKFISDTKSCKWSCFSCEETSFKGNASYEDKGDITITPRLKAVDVYSNKSAILYYIREVLPTEYRSSFDMDVNNGNLYLKDSLQNVTNNTLKEDFTVVVYIQAVSNRTLLETKNVTLNITVVVPPETTTYQTTTMEETTTVEQTTTTVMSTTSIFMRTTIETSPAADADADKTVVIVVPVVVVVILIVILIGAYFRNRPKASRKQQYQLDINQSKTKLKDNGVTTAPMTALNYNYV